MNFTDIMSTSKDMSKKEAAFALAALMEIPTQYKATQGLRPSEYLLFFILNCPAFVILTSLSDPSFADPAFTVVLRKHAQKASPPRILPPPNKVLERDNVVAASHAPATTSRSIDAGKNLSDEQVGNLRPVSSHHHVLLHLWVVAS